MFGTEYDFDSVLHYPTKAFSKDGKPTIVSNVPEGEELMVRRRFVYFRDLFREILIN
jgi:Astacin (Peptidase family M12A)